MVNRTYLKEKHKFPSKSIENMIKLSKNKTSPFGENIYSFLIKKVIQVLSQKIIHYRTVKVEK